MANTKEREYSYPEDLDLEPGSKTHDELVDYINQLALRSYHAMSRKHDTWDRIDELLNVYIDADEEEEEVLAEDSRKPTSIVIPTTFAALEAILTYYMGVFIRDPIFQYGPRTPMDTVRIMLLEKLIHTQCDNFKVGLDLHTHWRDGIVYGFGASAVQWTTKTRQNIQDKVDSMFAESGGGGEFVTSSDEEIEEIILAEGNDVVNIDPRTFLPDISVPIYKPQEGHYVGWVSRDSLMDLLDREHENPDDYFNCLIVKDEGAGSSAIYTEIESNSSRDIHEVGRTLQKGDDSDDSPDDVYLTHMYLKLIPVDWGLGESEYPEKWFFTVANDKTIVQAQRVQFYHDMFPVTVHAPDADGHTVSPIGRLETVLSMQEVTNWLFNSHMTNIRKFVNDMVVADPSIVNMRDVMNPSAGKIIRVRRSAWGKPNAVRDGIQQLPIADVTRTNLADATYLQQMQNLILGTDASMMGIQNRKGERVSATEAQGTRQSGLSRMQKMAMLTSMQSHQDIASMMAWNNIQFLQDEQYLEFVGEVPQELIDIYGSDNPELFKVENNDLHVGFNVKAHDGSMPMLGDADVWGQLFQVLAQNPQLNQLFDLPKIFMHMAKGMGAKNVAQFVRKGASNVVLQDSGTLQESIRKGDVRPASAGAN